MEPLSNIDAIYKQFPFLEKHASRSDIKKATVERWVTESVNNYYPTEYYRETDLLLSQKYPECCDAAMRTRLHLLNQEGETLYVVGENRHENIGQALHRLGELRKIVCYGLERVYYRRYRGFFKGLCWEAVPELLTIITLPQGISNCEDWVESIANHFFERNSRSLTGFRNVFHRRKEDGR